MLFPEWHARAVSARQRYPGSWSGPTVSYPETCTSQSGCNALITSLVLPADLPGGWRVKKEIHARNY